jgi:hypothetical protein
MLCGQHAFNTFFLSCLSLAVLLHHMQGVELCMYGKVMVFLMLLLLVACAGQTASPDGAVESAKDFPTGDPIEDVAAEFRGLRTVQGHFDGGDWNDDVDKWMGRKHQLMIQLGTHLGSGAYGKGKVVRLLGSPDRTASPGDDLFDLVDSLPEFERPTTGPYEFLIYYWRGTHDFLYFISQGETILNSGWWYAGE